MQEHPLTQTSSILRTLQVAASNWVDMYRQYPSIYLDIAGHTLEQLTNSVAFQDFDKIYIWRRGLTLNDHMITFAELGISVFRWYDQIFLPKMKMLLPSNQKNHNKAIFHLQEVLTSIFGHVERQTIEDGPKLSALLFGTRLKIKNRLEKRLNWLSEDSAVVHSGILSQELKNPFGGAELHPFFVVLLDNYFFITIESGGNAMGYKYVKAIPLGHLTFSNRSPEELVTTATSTAFPLSVIDKTGGVSTLYQFFAGSEEDRSTWSSKLTGALSWHTLKGSRFAYFSPTVW